MVAIQHRQANSPADGRTAIAFWESTGGFQLAGRLQSTALRLVPALLLGCALASAAHGQVLEPLPPLQSPAVPPTDQPLPGFPSTVPAGGVIADPNRVFGDDAPTLGGFDILAGIGLDLSASLRTEYSDNFARVGDGVPLPSRFESKDDFRITPMVSANVGRALGRQRLFLSANLGRDFYARNNVLNRNRLSANGGLQWTAGTRCSGRFQGGYSERGTRFSDFEEVIPSTQRTTNLLLNGGCATAGGLGFNGGYNWSRLTNSVEQRQYADTNSSGVNGSIFYRLGLRGDISIQGSSQNVRYPNQLLPDASENGLKLSSLTLAGGYRVGPSLRLNGGIGKSWVDPRSPLSSSFSGNTWNIGAVYSGPKLGANFTAGRDVSSGSSGFTGYQLTDSILAVVTYNIGARIDTSAGFSHRNQRNRGQSEFGGTAIQSFKQNRFFLGADYRLNRIVSAGIDFSHQKRTSEPIGFGYSANSVLLTLIARI